MIEDENIKDDNVEAVETETPEVNHVNNMVDSLVDGNNIAAQDSFKSALTDKIGQALDDKRKTVANDWLNSAIEQEEIADNSSLDGEPPAEQEGEQEVEQENEPVVSQA
jgi:hypothetical protein